MRCKECGKEIKNAYYINGIAYGYNCYKKKLALIYKQWEDEKNQEYSIKCFSAMQVFIDKKNNSFHDSIVNQWNECKKLTAKQLECIISGFTVNERISFYKIWFILSNDDNKKDIAYWLEQTITKARIWYNFLEDKEVHDIILHSQFGFCHGFHFYRDIEMDKENECYISKSGRKGNYLKKDLEDEYIEVLKIIECV